MKKNLIWAACFAALAFTSCHKDPTPTPTPEPQTITRLVSEEHIVNTGMTEMKLYTLYSWDDETLTRLVDSIDSPILNSVYHERMVYENGNLVKAEEESGKWQYCFTYDANLVKKFYNIKENDTLVWGEVTAYTTEGNVAEFMAYDNYKTAKWTLTWENGDAVKVVEEILEPADLAGTTVINYTYDANPSVYTGTPMAYYLVDGDGIRLAQRQSKHNRIEDGVSYQYNEDGYMISAESETEKATYEYIKHTIK